MNICVYGAASARIDKRYVEDGEALGRRIAKDGHKLVFGGGNSGLMGAVVRGVSEEGGESYGISPEFFKPDGVLFQNCTKMFYTADMRSRKAMLEGMADAFIITPGGTGTYDELFEIFTLKRLGRIHKPVAILNTLGYYDPLIELLNHTVRENFMMDYHINDVLFISDSIDEIMNYISK